MSRPFHPLTIQILEQLTKKDGLTYPHLHRLIAGNKPYKYLYNILYRLEAEKLIRKTDDAGVLVATITENGRTLLARQQPQRDGVWKMIIFDIPEKHKSVRHVLRAKLKLLHFKKWQNSIYVSPFRLDEEIESELHELGKKFFIRLIKTTDINHTQDLEKLFPEK